MSFIINSRLFAETEISGLEGQPGVGFHRLTVRLKVTFHPRKDEDQVVLTHLSGEISINGKQEGYLGRFTPRGGSLPVQTYSHPSSPTVQLDIELDRRLLEAIEDIRAGGDLTFAIFMYGRATHQGRNYQLQ